MIHPPATIARLTIARDRRGGWRMEREMGPDPARIFLGRTPEEAAKLAPLVFNLCGAAHGLAAAAALGLPADPAALARGMAQETARDHARAILLDWPLALKEEPDRASLGLIARPDGAPAVARALAGADVDLRRFSLSELEAWLDEAPTGTARLLARLRREVNPKEGRAALPPLGGADLAAALGPATRADGVPPTPRRSAALPPMVLPAQFRGGGAAPPSPAPGGAIIRFETGALARQARTPLVSALLDLEGPSLFVRLVARLLDALAALQGEAGAPAAPRAGIGLAEAARGLLGHGGRLENGRVAAYRVLSPSAWNLAPGGLLERAFAALGDGPQADRLAPLLVSAINPCVPVTLKTEAAHA